MQVLIASSCPTLQSRGLQRSRILFPWDFPGKNTEADCHSLFQVILPTQGSNPELLHCWQILYRLMYQRSPDLKTDCRNQSFYWLFFQNYLENTSFFVCLDILNLIFQNNIKSYPILRISSIPVAVSTFLQVFFELQKYCYTFPSSLYVMLIDVFLLTVLYLLLS